MEKILTQKYILILFTFFAGVYLILAIIGGINHYSPVPYYDMWEGYLNFYVFASAGDLNAWWDQHYEHRIILSKILFWLDLDLFKGRIIFLIIVNYLLVALIFFVFYKILKERLPNEKDKFTRDIIGTVIFCLIFSWVQEQNFTWAFQSQFFLAQLLPLSAFFLLYKAHSSESKSYSTRYYIFACLLGVVSIGTMAIGVLTLPLMIVLAVLFRMQFWRISILLLLTFLAISLYFYNYQPPPRPPLIETLMSAPVDLLKFILLYLGSPVYFLTKSILLTQLSGLFLVLGTLWFVWNAVHSFSSTSLEWVLLIFLFYIGASALAAGSG